MFNQIYISFNDETINKTKTYHENNNTSYEYQ